MTVAGMCAMPISKQQHSVPAAAINGDDNPSSDELKAHRERELFRTFAACARLNISDGSIASRPSPEPDILCLLDGSPSAFELGELSDEILRESFALTIEFKRVVDSEFQALPHDVGRSIQLEYRAHVNVTLSSLASRRDYNCNATDLLMWLARERPPPGSYEGIELPESIRASIEGIDVRFGGGFLVSVTRKCPIGTLDLRVLDRKLGNGYKTSNPIELLLHCKYFTASREEWLENYGQHVRDKINGSKFRRVWIFKPAERSGDRDEVWLVHENSAQSLQQG